MAAKERKSALNKHLNKEIQSDKEKTPETPKLRRSRKSASSLLNDNKTNSEQKSPVPSRKRKKENAVDGSTTPVPGRGRRLPLESNEETEAAKTPPPSGLKNKKAFLEKELEDILENATGRNTPSMSRNRKLNEKEEDVSEVEKLVRTRKNVSDSLEALEEKGGFFLPKTRKGNEKDIDDDNLSVRSAPTFLRTRKNFDKEIDDDVLSVRSMSVRSKKGDANEDDSMSVRSLPRPVKVKKVERKKKPGVAVAKKKILVKGARGSPKKGNEVKGKVLKAVKTRQKAAGKGAAEAKVKKIMKKPLKFQNKKKGQKRPRSTMFTTKKQRLKNQKPKSPEEKSVTGRQKTAAAPPKEEVVKEIVDGVKEKSDVAVESAKNEKERLNTDQTAVKSESSDVTKAISNDEPKKGGKSVGKFLLKFVGVLKEKVHGTARKIASHLALPRGKKQD